MKKIIPLFIIILILICPIFASEVHASTVFLTSDNVLGQSEDFEMLNDIKSIIESKSDGTVTVIVDSSASNPGEGSRAMEADCDLAVTVAYACAGNLLDLAEYSTKVNKKIVFVNAGSLDLTSLNFLRRSYDDNWSSYTFAAIQQPSTFLSDAGITLIQPGQTYPDQTDDGNLDYSSSVINEYIADIVLSQLNSESGERQLDSSLIVSHQMNPKYLAEDSAKIVSSHGGELEESYGSYTTQQLLYMSASYLAGYSLKVPTSYQAPDNPETSSMLTKGSYSFNEWCEIADIVVDYMNQYGKAPDSIEYNGATIGYEDLVYNFALLTEDDVDASHMNFPQKSEFHSFHDNFLMSILPIGIIVIIILAIVFIIRKVIKSRRQRKMRNRRARKFQNNVNMDYYEDYSYRSNKPKRLNRQNQRRRRR